MSAGCWHGIDDILRRGVVGQCVRMRLSALCPCRQVASMASMMFFGGGWWDGVFTFLLGTIGGFVNYFSNKRFKHLGRIEAFITSFVCALCARFVHR